MFKTVFASKWGITISGLAIGVFAVALQKMGNPANMGICVACFTRDIAGSLGFHQAAAVQYLRPEIFGIVLGAFVSALAFGDFKPRGGSIPLLRFVLGAIATIGALAFLGCPWRAVLRLAGGDMNAVVGLLGLIFGVFVGTRFFRWGYNPGSASRSRVVLGLTLPFAALGLLILMFFFLPVTGEPTTAIFRYSISGPGAQRAPIYISLMLGLFIGVIAQRSRFCTIGGIRDFILFRQVHLLIGFLSLLITVFIGNLIFGTFNLGFADQPIAHTNHLWNFFGMTLSGLAFSLAGGCPGRQLIMASEGDGDATNFVFGTVAGAAIAHNFNLAASGAGVSLNGQIGVGVGLVIALLIAFGLRQKG
jgi:YedE family putative selenium metabolism protein